MMKFLTKIGCFLCLLVALTATVQAQQLVVDKMIATVSDGAGTKLITYSDLLWQLALEPDSSLDAPSRDDLNQVFERLTQQRLIALEAERLPAAAPTDDAVNQEIRRLVAVFPSAANFEARLRRVGFESTDDPNFRQIIEQRLAINNYLDFRFRSFVVVTPQDEEQFYKDTFIAEFRRANSGVVVPSLDQARTRVNKELTERRIESDIEKFLEEAKVRAIITTLNPL